MYSHGSSSSAAHMDDIHQFLHKTSIKNGFVSEKPVQLILGHSQLDLEQGNCGIFLYRHGRLIESWEHDT
ncbi:hypothetical protein HanPSC8_Chr13g0587771 [Helianthus annuus]|nr:hypothetical protein HanPSC8_Chr13g0587771 [Helianthus annuus]